jgi:uncharacterized protein YciI
MHHWLLTYDLAPDYLERRTAYRTAHLALAQEAVARGDLLLGAEQAMLLFQAETAAAAQAFAAADPYVAEGLVIRWTIRKWITVVGEHAATPIT